MIERFRIGSTLLSCVYLALLLSACAGKDEVTAVDAEKQAFEDLREQVREAVASPAQEAEAIRLVDELEKDLAALRTRIAERKKTVRQLNANYDTPRADFETYFEKVGKEIGENRRKVSETHQALLSTVSAEERDAIAKAHTKAMNAAIASIQSI